MSLQQSFPAKPPSNVPSRNSNPPAAVNNNTIPPFISPSLPSHVHSPTKNRTIRSLRDARNRHLQGHPASRSLLIAAASASQRTPRPSLPLHQGNIQTLEDSQNLSPDLDSFPINADQPLCPAISCPPSPTPPNNNLDTSLKEAAYKIFVNHGRELLSALNEHISNCCSIFLIFVTVPVLPSE